jgi:hypothetical protein
MNGYRADRDIVAARIPLHIAAEGSKGYLPYTKLCKSSVYVPFGQLDRRQFLALGRRECKDTADGFETDNSCLFVTVLFGMPGKDRPDDFFGFAAFEDSTADSIPSFKRCSGECSFDIASRLHT